MKPNPYWRFIIHLIIGYLLQVTLLQGRWMGYYAVLYPYLLPMIALPMQTYPVVLLMIGFALGISIDMLYSTLGTHALACVVIAYLRPFVINTMASQSLQKMYRYPRLYTMGWVWFLTYATSIILMHHLLIYIFEAGIWTKPWRTLLQWISSSAMTLMVFCVWEMIAKLSAKRP